MKKKFDIMPAVVLSAICLVAALLLSGINMVTGPIIQAAQEAEANSALLVVLPDGKNFKEIELNDTYPPAITKGYSADGGFVFQATVTGKSSGLIIMCGINSDGKIVATKVIENQETPGYAEKVFPSVEGTAGKYTGADLNSFEPYLVAGATLTSKAYSEAVKAALQAFVIANGGEVDIRTPEQILQDNCNTALGTTGATFTKWFATEALDGIDAVYESEAGRVYVMGENFVGIKADGTVATSGVDASLSAKATSAHTTINGITLTEVTERPEGIHANILGVHVTNSGNYVFKVKAEGFSALHEYGAGDPIILKVSISADGKIIDCITLEHGESKGYGDKCATEEYYDSWIGVTADKVVISASPVTPETTDPGAIASSTYTTEGYQKAMKRAFAAFELLTGGNQNG